MATKKPTIKKKSATKKAPAKKPVVSKAPVKTAAQKRIEQQEGLFGSLRVLNDFFQMEAAGGIILMLFAVAAMIVANGPLGDLYYHVFHNVKLNVTVGPFVVNKDLIHWINDGLMAIFFFLVGLEIKRELLEGALNSRAKAILPLIAALGGMLVPAGIYIFMNHGNPQAMPGWAVPMATDIAFALGVLMLLGKRVPIELKVFLLALAIFDDLGAILVIAAFYSGQLNLEILPWAAVCLLILFGMNRCRVNRASYYMIIAVIMWFCVLKSGVHATLAGVIAALFIPLRIPGERRSILVTLEHDLHGLVAFVILPIFAFANAGVELHGMSPSILWDSVTLGVILGLFVGKQIGIFGFTYAAVKLGIAKLPKGVNWAQVWGVSMLGGIGFTMSLFVASLGFRVDPHYLGEAKLGILTGSLISAVAGASFLLMASKKKK